MKHLCRLLSALLVLTCVPLAYSQEVRASIMGNVTDSTGAAVVGAVVQATNLSTNQVTTANTSDTGNYVTPFLAPGKYVLTIEAKGFKKYVREDVILQAQDKARVDVKLEVGEVTTSVTVNEAVSQLQTESASRSQTLANEIVANVPTQGRNPFQIAWAASGVVKSGTFRYLRSFDIGGMSGLSINGGREKTNEILQDGISDVQADYTVISAPTTESVQEFKVQANTYDAQYGRTGGGVISIVTKGGGNDFHGTAFEYFQNDKLNANQSELKRYTVTADGTVWPNGRMPPMHINQFGITASGPVVIPKLFNGKNRVFWMLSWESMRQRSADPGVVTVPQMDIRGGDFTKRFNGAGTMVTIYDPFSTQANGSRTPIAGNRIPTSQINPVATKVLSYYAPPTGPGVGPSQANNYPFASMWRASFDQFVGRTDVVVNSKNNVFFRYNENPFQEYRAVVFGLTNPAEPTSNAPLQRDGRNVMMDWTSTLSPTMTFDLRMGVNRWEETGGSTIGAGFDPAQLGFSSAITSQISRYQFPRFDFNGGTDYQSIGSDANGLGTRDTYSLQPNFNKVMGRHFLKFGADLRQFNMNNPGRGYPSGYYNFDKGWTQANANTTNAVSGDAIASFLMGLPSNGRIEKNIDTAYRHMYYGGFIQDDWKVNSRLSLNLGIRWDTETGNLERFDRSINGLDFNAASPIAAASGLALKGVPLFANIGGVPRAVVGSPKGDWQPRIGIAYRMDDKWVLRGGYGIYYVGSNETGGTAGFSQATSAVVTNPADGLTPYPGMSLTNAFNAYPNSKLLDPVGTARGASSFLGEGVAAFLPDRGLPYVHQYSFDIQRELPGGILAEAGYGGNTSRNVSLNAVTVPQLNYIPASEMGKATFTSTGAVDASYYTAQVPNPMKGLIPNNPGMNGATISRTALMYAYPQFAGLSFNSVPAGRQQFHGANFKLTKRFSKGLSFLAAYSIGKNLRQVRMLNPQDFGGLTNWSSTTLVKESDQNIDTPQKFVVAGIYELPFGKGRSIANNVPGIVNQIIGGWQLNYNVTYQKGWVVDYPNAPQTSPGSAKLSNPTFSQVFDTSLWAGATVPNTTYFYRTFPYFFSDVRRPGYQNWDTSLSKYFPIHESLKLQFRFEMVNMFNHPWFANMQSTDVTNALFGQLNPVQQNLPRFIKLAMHLNW